VSKERYSLGCKQGRAKYDAEYAILYWDYWRRLMPLPARFLRSLCLYQRQTDRQTDSREKESTYIGPNMYVPHVPKLLAVTYLHVLSASSRSFVLPGGKGCGMP